MLDTGQLADFLIGMQEAKNEELTWDFYLHRVQENISFDEFKARLVQPEPVGISTNALEATVKYSFEMMESFHPE